MGIVAVVEANGTGHRLGYVRLVVEAAQRHGYAVRLFLPDGWRTLPEVASLGELSDAMVVEPVSALRAEPARMLDGCMRLVIPDADRHLATADLRAWSRILPLSLLIMRAQPDGPGIRARARFAVKWVLMAWYRSRGHRVLRLVSFFTPASMLGKSDVADPVVLHRDLAVLSRLRADLDLTPGLFWIAIVGGLDRRKNLETVTDALTLGLSGCDPIGVVLLGRVAPDYAAAVDGLVERLRLAGVEVRCHDEFVTAERLDATIELVDAVVVAYSNRGPSGIAARAAALGTLVLAAGSPTLADDAARAPRHVLWEPLSVDGITRLIRRGAVHRRPTAWDDSDGGFGERLIDVG